MKTNKLPPKGTPEWHRLEIARKTIRMHPAIVNVLGGMTIDEAKKVILQYSSKP